MLNRNTRSVSLAVALKNFGRDYQGVFSTRGDWAKVLFKTDEAYKGRPHPIDFEKFGKDMEEQGRICILDDDDGKLHVFMSR